MQRHVNRVVLLCMAQLVSLCGTERSSGGWHRTDGGDQNHRHERAMRWSKYAFERNDREIAHSVLFPCLLGPQPFCTHSWGGAENKGSCFA